MNRRPLAWLLALVVPLLTGCATSAVEPTRAHPVPPRRLLPADALYDHPAPYGAHVVVIRDAGRFDALETVELQVDGRAVANLRPGERLDLFVYAGERLLGVKSAPGFIDAADDPHRFVFNPGRTYFLRVGRFGRFLDVRAADPAR